MGSAMVVQYLLLPIRSMAWLYTPLLNIEYLGEGTVSALLSLNFWALLCLRQ